MISIETGYLISKLFICGLAIAFLTGVYFNLIRKTEFVVMTCVFGGWFLGQYLKEASDFYTFYLYFAFNSLLVVAASLVWHVTQKIEHSKEVYWVYALVLVQFVSYMVLYRVRVKIYASDAPILWLINTHGVVVLACDLLILAVLYKGLIGRWKLR